MRGSRVASSASAPHTAWQVHAPLVHVQSDGSQAVLHKTDWRLEWADRKNLYHFDGSGVAVFLSLPAEACAGEPADGRRQLASRGAKELVGEDPVNLVCVSSLVDVEEVSETPFQDRTPPIPDP